jgi:hypothetical protein
LTKTIWRPPWGKLCFDLIKSVTFCYFATSTNGFSTEIDLNSRAFIDLISSTVAEAAYCLRTPKSFRSHSEESFWHLPRIKILHYQPQGSFIQQQGPIGQSGSFTQQQGSLSQQGSFIQYPGSNGQQQRSSIFDQGSSGNLGGSSSKPQGSFIQQQGPICQSGSFTRQ